MRVSWIAALCLLAAGPAATKPYQIEDMLKLQSYGKAQLSPDGQWAVIERFRPYDSAAAYGFDVFNKRMLGQIWKVDLKDGRPPELLFEQDPDAGYWAGSLSPDGQHLTVFRLETDKLSLGIVRTADRSVRWLDINPVPALLNPVPIWRGNSRLIVLASEADEIAYPLDSGNRLQRRLPVLWQRTASGQIPGMTLTTSKSINPSGQRSHRQVMEIDLASHGQRLLAKGQVLDLAVSADGNWLALLEETSDAAPAPAEPVSPSARPRHHRVRLISLADGQVIQPCPTCDILPGLLAWSDRSSALVVSVGSAQSPQGQFIRIDPDKGSVVALTDKTSQPWVADNDSGARIVRAGWHQGIPRMLLRAKDGQPIWSKPGEAGAPKETLPCSALQIASNGRALLVPCSSGLWRIFPGGKPEQLIGGAARLDQPFEETFDTGITERYRAIVPASDRSFWVQRTQEAAAITPNGRRVLTAKLPLRASRLLLFSAKSGKGLAVSRTGSGASQLWRIGTNRAPELLDTINGHLENVEPPEAIALPSQVPDRVDWLLLPVHARPGERVPMVIIPYPGAQYARVSGPPITPDSVVSVANPLLALQLGYAVLLPSLRHDRFSGEPAEGLVDQIEAATDRAVASGRIDRDRIAVFGHSFGGYTALLTASRSKRFRAFIAAAAVPDLFLQHGSLLPYDTVGLEQGYPLGSAYGWAELGQAGLRAAPWHQPDRYIRNSPYFSLHHIASPVLLIHGDLDPVSLQGAERMFSGLYREGKDVSLLRFWGEGHVVRSPANIRAMWQHIDQWLADKLMNKRHASPHSMEKQRADPFSVETDKEPGVIEPAPSGNL